MLKLVRLALTAAILTAIAVRLRRRSHMPAEPPAPPAERPARTARMGLVWAAIAAIVAVTLAAAVLPTQAQQVADEEARAYQAEQDAMTAELMNTPPPAVVTVTPPPPAPLAEILDPGCSPARRPVTVRPIRPKVKRAVDGQWRRIERWLKANAPGTYRTLGGPGRAHTIAVAESQMSVDFPDDLRASLLRHNGSKGRSVLGFWNDDVNALSIRQIRDAWRELCSRERAGLGTDPAGEHWSGRMIPFLSFTERDSADMGYAVVDSVAGAVGWHDTVSGMAPRLPSTHALLRAVADALEEGKELDGRRPAVNGGVLRWEDAG